MRVIFIKQTTDWTALSAQLLATDSDSAQALATLRRTNPHLDFQKLGAGAVVLVPELPGLKDATGKDGKDGKSNSISGDAFAALQDQLMEEVSAATAESRAGWAELVAEQREVMVALKKLNEIIGQDPDLQAQTEQALKAAKSDAANAKAADATLKAVEEDTKTELATLGRLLGVATQPVKPSPKKSRTSVLGKAE
jgi:hypothetical protein